MDLWVVAVAAGAGYLGKHLQNLSLSEREKLVQSYSKISNLRQSEPGNLLQQIWDKTCHIRRLGQKGVFREPSSEQNDVLDRPLEMHQFDGHADSLLGRASASENVRLVDDINVLRLSTPSPGFSGRESCPHNVELIDVTSRSSCRICMSKLHKSRYSGHVFEPLGSLERNLEKGDEYGHSSLPTPLNPTIGPLLVSGGSSNVRQSNENSHDSYSAFSSSSSSNNLKSVELQKHARGSQEMKAFESPGPASGMLLFLIGLTIGIMPEVFTYAREIKKLNEQLIQAENLVQDLQEELDMKDRLTVKEIAAAGSQPWSTKIPSPFSQELTVSCSEPEAEVITSYDSKIANKKNADNYQSISKIEAELEAELEMLGLNMDLERTSEFVELGGPEYEVGTIQGDIKLDAVQRRQYENASESESDEESGTTNGQTPPANYAVSPRELSIRLHEVIESRLEARIKELESAILNNQNKFHLLESQCITSLGSAYSGGESLSTPESPYELSGNAIDTLDEVKGGKNKMTGKDPETKYAVSNCKSINPEVPPFEKELDDAPNCRNNGFITPLNITED